jgi:hypothetical protein
MTAKKPKLPKNDYDPSALTPEGFARVNGELRAIDPHSGEAQAAPNPED